MTDRALSPEMQEIWALFAQEGRENLSGAENALLQLEQDPSDTEQVKTLFRALHNFKGSARMMGLSVIESLAHRAEDLIALIRDEGVILQAAMVALLFSTLDRLRSMLDGAVAQHSDVEPSVAEDLILSLSQMIGGSKGMAQSGETSARTDGSSEPQTGAGALESNHESARTEMDAESAGAAGADAKVELQTATPIDDLNAFLRAAENVLGELHAAMDVLATGADDALVRVAPLVNALRATAERLGYARLVAMLADLLAELRREQPAQDAEAGLARLKKLELELFEELTRIQESSASDETTWSDIAWVFRHWNAERVFADLARVSTIVDQLSSPLSPEALSQRDALAEQATTHLRAVYHSCIFYHLDQAAHLTLALEDLYARVAQGELTFSPVLADLTRASVTALGSAIDGICEGLEPQGEELAGLVEQTKNFLYLQPDGSAHQVTRDLLSVLDLPHTFKEGMTPETIAQFSRALQAGEHFYTVLADLERDEKVDKAFFEWVHSEDIHLVTNITVYRHSRSLFNFLFSTTQSREQLLEALIRIDPKWQYFTLQVCTLKKDAAPQRDQSPEPLTRQALPSESGSDATLSTEVVDQLSVDQLSEQIGTLVASHTSLHRIVRRLGDSSLIETALQLLGETDGNGARAEYSGGTLAPMDRRCKRAKPGGRRDDKHTGANAGNDAHIAPPTSISSSGLVAVVRARIGATTRQTG